MVGLLPSFEVVIYSSAVRVEAVDHPLQAVPWELIWATPRSSRSRSLTLRFDGGKARASPQQREHRPDRPPTTA